MLILEVLNSIHSHNGAGRTVQQDKPFWLVLLTEHEVPHCYAMNAVYRCVVAGQL